MNTPQHLVKAERNKDIVVNHLLGIVSSFPDWVSIGAFYSALHFIEALLATNGIHVRHHERRHTLVASLMNDVSSAYMRLYDLGFSSRYEDVGQMPSASEANVLVQNELDAVERYVRQRLP